jgi:hypothetical protein
MSCDEYALDLYLGEYREQPVIVKQDGLPYDLTGVWTGSAKLVFSMKRSQTDDTAVLTKECPAPSGTPGEWTMDDVTAGETTLYLTTDDTKDLSARTYTFDVWLVRDDGEYVPAGGNQQARLRRGVTWPV